MSEPIDRKRPGKGNGRPRPATMADVARRAGVSTTTVSFVLNSRPISIPDETRERVLAAARELRYAGNAHVDALRKRRSQTLGIHMHYHRGQFPTDPVLGPIFAGISGAARERGYHLFLYTGIPGQQDEPPVETFLDRRVDGLVFVHASEGSKLMAELAEVHLPCVVVFNRNAPEELGFVDAENVRGARMAVEYLASLGHRRIGHLTRALANSNRTDRSTGYREGLGRAGLGFDLRLEAMVQPGEGAERGLRELLDVPDPPTALFCYHDQLAAQAIRLLVEWGWRVPHDVSVVGYDDNLVATLISPSLTTIRQPLREMGLQAIHALADMIDGVPASERRIFVPVELVVRESTGPPPPRSPG